jgi:hypothetical protein
LSDLKQEAQGLLEKVSAPGIDLLKLYGDLQDLKNTYAGAFDRFIAALHSGGKGGASQFQGTYQGMIESTVTLTNGQTIQRSEPASLTFNGSRGGTVTGSLTYKVTEYDDQGNVVGTQTENATFTARIQSDTHSWERLGSQALG